MTGRVRLNSWRSQLQQFLLPSSNCDAILLLHIGVTGLVQPTMNDGQIPINLSFTK
jgi:hypothetical protein